MEYYSPYKYGPHVCVCDSIDIEHALIWQVWLFPRTYTHTLAHKLSFVCGNILFMGFYTYTLTQDLVSL